MLTPPWAHRPSAAPCARVCHRLQVDLNLVRSLPSLPGRHTGSLDGIQGLLHGFVEIAANAGAETLELNLQPSDGTFLFDSHRHGPATDIVPAFVEEILRPG